MRLQYLKIILISLFIFTYSCKADDTTTNNQQVFYVALPTSPVKVDNTEGSWLVYELHIKAPALDKLEVYYNSELIQTYSDFITKDNLHLASIWLAYPETGWEKEQLTHQFYYTNTDGTNLVENFTLPISKQYPEAKNIAFPVPQGVWLAEGAPGNTSYHTRAIFPYPEPIYDPEQDGYLIGNNPQRYAIDYAQIENGLPYKNDGTSLEDWYCYNQPVAAVASGTVLFTKNTIPDHQTPGEYDYDISIENVTGNVVYIEHFDGTISTYCHLIPNSVTVQAGEVVTTGQELGRLGNSGNSSAPHLHMHVLTNPESKQIQKYEDGLYFESLPYAFPQFKKLGQLPPGYLDEPPLTPFTPTTAQDFNNALPAESDVIEF
ncbi:M23 family metallopeptidase [uncultured Marixanthomonas sp.]|uniref:M23 family metallopeptidase n=1 Tax=uncultured Marixanthomonas sp. TaxID=757245 RepID=UPI0030D86A76